MDANPDPPLLHRQIDTAGWVLVVILAVATLWRLVFFFEMYASPYAHDLGLDGAVFHASALEVAAGSWSEDEVFFQAPLYPIALGTVYRFLGPSPVAAKLFQILLGIASCWLIYRIALHIFDRAVAAAAASLAAVYGPFLFFANELVVETFFIFMLLAAFAVVLEASRRGGALWWGGAGLAIGFAATARGTILPFAALVPLWMLGTRNRPHRMRDTMAEVLAFSLAVVLPIAPVTLHNYLADGSLVLVASNDGVNFFIGNNPESDGMTAAVVGTRGDHLGGKEDQIELARADLGNPEASAGAVSRWWYGQGFQFIRDQPQAAFKLLLRKGHIFINAYEVGNNRVISFMGRHSLIFSRASVGYWFVLPVAAAGLILGWSRRPLPILLLLFVLSYAGLVILFFVTARYRLPVVPGLIIFAAVALVEWGRWLSNRGWRADRRAAARVAASVAVAILVAIVMRPVPSIRNPLAQAFFNEAEAYRTHRDYANAAIWYQRALDEFPAYCDAAYNLARIHTEVFSDPRKVIEVLEPVSESCASDAGARTLLGQALIAVGRSDEGHELLASLGESDGV